MHLARQQTLTGWVRNLPDGRVELVAEGNSEALASFLNELRNLMGPYIRNVQEDYGTASGRYERYEIIY